MFESLFPLIGQSGAALVVLSGLGIVSTVALSELLGAWFRARRHGGLVLPESPRKA